MQKGRKKSAIATKRKIRKVPASKARKPISKKGASSKKKASAPLRVLYRIKGKFASKKQFDAWQKKNASVKPFKKYPVKAKHYTKLIVDSETGKSETEIVNSFAIADIGSPPLLAEVTSQKEKFSVIHEELRSEAIKKGRFFVPDERLRKIATPFNKGLHQSKQVGKFLTEDTRDDISNLVWDELKNMEERQVHGKARFYVAFHMTEYGLETYGSDKGSIAKKNNISTETLHWTAFGTAGMNEIEHVAKMVDAKMGDYLKKSTRTTLVIESVDVTMIYERNQDE